MGPGRGPRAPPPPEGARALGRRAQAASAGRGLQGWRVTGPPPSQAGALLALQVHPRPLLGPSVETAFRPKFCSLRL